MAALSSPSIFPKSQEPSSPSPLPLLPKVSSFREIQQFHASAVKLRRLDNSFIFNLINSLSLNPTPASIHHAHKLFDQIPHPDTVIFNTLSRVFSRSDDPNQAIVLFYKMLMASIPPDSYSFPSLLKACASTRALPEGKQAHAAAIKLGFALNAFVLPSLITMYSQCGDIKAARSVFDRGTDRCVVSFNSMITAFVQSSRPGEALALFREMQSRQLRPTFVTILGVLAACALIGALHLGKWIHDYAKKNGFSSCVKVNTALIDMYGKCGSLEDAVEVFEGMALRDAQAWSAMIVAYAIHGQGRDALNLFDEMRHRGISPDGITFIGILYSCSHSGMVERGLQYFRSMSSDYGIVPGIKHYGCIVDLLARTGRLEEAYDFINGLPIEPTPILWRTLLSACGGHGNVELGKKVFDRIIELDESHGGDYVMLSNVCALNGMWEDVKEIRKMMRERGAAKVPGCSSIEVDGEVHEFFAGDGKHRECEEVRRMVDGVMEGVKAVGYVADICKVRHLDLTEEEKEERLRYHSEKMAIGFGLMKTPPGTIIRVVKNLRICSDCHSMAKLVSMVFGRKIILRDLNRFHHFDGGQCSCADYW